MGNSAYYIPYFPMENDGVIYGCLHICFATPNLSVNKSKSKQYVYEFMLPKAPKVIK